MSKWINCKEKLPKAEFGESDSVLTVSDVGMCRILYFDGGCWCYPTGEVFYSQEKITHWMPLPEPPHMED